MKQSQPLKTRSGILAVSMLSLVSMTGLGTAADLDQILYASPQQDTVRPVEIGSGWYLRGDIAYTPSNNIKGRIRELNFLGSERFDTKAAPAYSGGVGYQFTDNFRGDLTVGYRNMKLSDNPVDAGIWDVMANAYYDLGNLSGVTPYIGAGIGLAKVDYKFHNELDGWFGGRDTTRLQWALMAGAAIDMTENLKLDLGYRYSRISAGNAADLGLLTIADKGIDSHQLRAGLRFTTW